MRKKLSIVLLLVGVMLLAGCSDLASVQITHDARSTLELGETVNLTASGLTSLDTPARLTEAEWTVSNESVATVVGNGTEAVLTVVGPGEVVVTATAQGVSGSVAFTVISNLPDPVVFTESFEAGEVGAYPAGWIVVEQAVHDGTGHSGARISSDRASDGSQSLKLTSVPDGEGAAEFVFDQPLLYNRLTVDLWKDPNATENVNLELHTEEGRIGGLFITSSGQMGYRRPDGANKPYYEDGNVRFPNGQWNRVEFEWNDEAKIYKVFVTIDGSRLQLTPSSGTPFEEAYAEGQVVKFKASVTKRDMEKVAYIDNIEVVDLAIVDMLSQ
ncbi:MAG TPA: hypothetical protein GX739_01880 [Firmicutes bacterium]|nr:hypothetical protein [Bacillota bacterium]